MARSETRPIVAITNLHPLPWEPTRASFNKQQFDALEKYQRLKIVVLVPWLVWLKHRRQAINSDTLRYVPFFNLPKHGRYFTHWFQYAALRRIKGWLLADDPVAFYGCWLYPDAVAVARASAKWGVPCLVKAHGTDVNYHASDPRKLNVMRDALSAVERIFCPSDALKQVLLSRGFDGAKVITNYNGVDKQVFFPLSVASSTDEPQTAQKTKLIFVGSLIKTKGIFELIDAMQHITQSLPVELVVVGSGNDQHAVKQRIEALGLSSHIRLAGSQPLSHVAQLVRESDLLVLPSYREGLPNVVLEAFASGIPVVATDVGGIPEVVTERTGVLVSPQSVASLVDGLTKALNQTWDTQDILNHALQFDWQRNAKCIIDTIDSIEGSRED